MAAVLEGSRISLRPVREADQDRLYDAHTDIGARGAYFPFGVKSESAFRHDFSANWSGPGPARRQHEAGH